MTEIRYEQVPVEDLKPYPGNARRGDVEMLRKSLRSHGQYRPIVVQESTGYILAGNHTWLAAQAEGWEKIDVGFIDVEDDQARRIVLMDNRSNDLAGYDQQALADLLIELDTLEGTGYDSSDLDALIAEVSPAYGRGGSAMEPPEVPVTQRGDLIILGEHRLLCGDATEEGDLRKLFGGPTDMRAALVVTSPPYNQQLDSFTPSGMQKENPDWVNRMAQAYKDSLPEDEYRALQRKMFFNVMQVCAPDASFFYNHKVRYRDKQVVHPLEWVGDLPDWRVRQEIIWDRSSSITLNARMFMPCDERIYWLTRGEKFNFNDRTEIKSLSTVWRVAPHAEIQLSAPFPVELPERCISACSDRGDIVLDPYAGTGTTMVAAHRLGRRAFLVEVDPGYCDVIVTRYEELTGDTAVRPNRD